MGHSAPRLSQPQPTPQPEQDKAKLTNAQRSLLDALRAGAQSLRWSADGSDAATPEDVLDFFTDLKAGAAQLHAIRDAHSAAPELASFIGALEQLLQRFGDALKPGTPTGIVAKDFDIDAQRTVFGALSALADPSWPSLFNRTQRRALQPLMQRLSSALLSPAKKRFASAAGASEHLPLLNWICRGVKKGLLKPDRDITALFENAIGGVAGWLGAEDLPADSYQIGECAAILNAVIEHDLLSLKNADEAASQRSRELTQCALLLFADRAIAVLEKPPVNGVAVINLCNLIKELIEARAISTGSAQPQLQRLLTLIVGIPNKAMSGGDGRVLSNAGNFLRMLMTRTPADGADGKAQIQILMPACRRVLAALNADDFGRSAKNAQSLSNLASFLQDFHRHVLPGVPDDGLRKSFASALDNLIAKILATRVEAFNDRWAIDGVLAALDYLQSQGMGKNTPELQTFRDALRARHSGLAREKGAEPAPLAVMDAELPKLSAAPALSKAESEPGSGSGGGGKRPIPGQGAIVEPPAMLDAAQIVPGTTYVRPTAGRGKFARPGSVEADAFSLAARDAFVVANEKDSSTRGEDEDDESSSENVDSDKEAHGKSQRKEDAKGRGESNGHGQQRGGVAAGRGKKPRKGADVGRHAGARSTKGIDWNAMTSRQTPDADMLSAAIRSGNVKGMEQMMQELKSHPETPLPLLPASFLAEACRGKFFNDRGRVNAMNAYLGFLGKAGKEQLATQLGKSSSISSTMHELLVRNGIRNRYGLMQYDAFLKEVRHVISFESEMNYPTQELSRILAQADEACIRKLAREHGTILTAVPAALLRLEKDAPTGWFLSGIDDGKTRDALMQKAMCELIRKGYEDQALERLLRHGGTNWLYLPTLQMSLSPRIAEAPFYNLPMYAIAYARRSAVKLMLQTAPKLFAERYLFGFSVLSAALLKDDRDIFQDLLAGLHPDVLDALATEPVLSPEEAMFRWTSDRGASNRKLQINLDGYSGFTLKNMPGFNLLAFASASEAVGCLRILLSHDNGRLARQTSLAHWGEIFAWPHLEPAVKDILEDFIVDQLCRCIPQTGSEHVFVHWMLCGQHLFIDAKSAKGIARTMRLAVEHKREDLAGLLLEKASRAQLDALKEEAGSADWTSVFPGIDERMLALLKAAEHQADANERAASAHSSAAASSRAPQSLQ